MDICSLGRAYKDRTPQQTIKNIRKILDQIELFVFEKIWFNPHDKMVSTTIITDSDHGSFYSNGKSQSSDYCLASAYGEFIERLQNNTHLLNIPQNIYQKLNDDFGFYSYPDETFLDENELSSLPTEVLSEIFSDNSSSEYYRVAFENNGKGCLAVPFFDVKNSKVINIPYNSLLSLTGSNGMSAGNTAPEAICQAIFELMERWAAARVYFNQLTPPDIPITYLKDKDLKHELEIIQDLQDRRLTVTIKDFSCGDGLPVVGVIILDLQNSKYFLSLGSDSSFEVALNRTLTELYQGVGSIDAIRNRMMPIPKSKSKNIQDDYLLNQFELFLKDGSGLFTKELFGKIPSYEVSLDSFGCKYDFSHELKHWISFILGLGHNLYIRNVSFLGFPSFHVYIPNVSIPETHTGYKAANYDEVEKLQKAIRCCYDFKNYKATNYSLLQTIIDSFRKVDYNEKVTSVFGVEISETNDAKKHQISVGNFLIILYMLLLDIPKSYSILTQYRKIVNNNGDYLFTVNLMKIIDYTTQSFEDEIVFNRIDGYQSVASTILDYIRGEKSNYKKIIAYLKIPLCPDCDKCFWYRFCLTRGRLKLAALVNPMYKKNAHQVKQSSIAEVIEF